ncbi:uncharacterized protein LOC115003985 isoform X2 [Cottoperca gobio]|uniref:Uncharacterized protein LOC115003985 isoform X2 n=1 Tax=Cottoperca gobio TaxID=56716 RepID=A0A6J2P8V0_COTGO|nr:uncharacterized protein LOC115003985 isoform X2 [Cottoperca gobio]
MTSSNIATVFAPCLLPPPNKAEMSEGRLKLRVLVLQTFIDNPDLFGAIPKDVIDSMEFLINFPHLKAAKGGHRKRHSLKVKTVPWIQARPKVKLGVSEQSQESPSRARPTLRRSLGLETFPNVLLFRTCMPYAEHSFRPAPALLDSHSPVDKEACKTPQEGLKRFTRGHDADGSPVLTGVGKLQLTPWRRRISL